MRYGLALAGLMAASICVADETPAAAAKPTGPNRMAVLTFRSATGDTIRWCGQSESSAMWLGLLADRLTERLAQTRKFKMLDRKFDAEVNAELARLSGANASKADAVRMNQKLGTDYLIVGEVRFFSVVAPGTNPLTGQVQPMVSQRFAEISYRVLMATTGSLDCSDTFVLDAASFPAASIAVFASDTAEAAAQSIAAAIMANLLPYEIVGQNGVGELIVGEGGKSLSVGDRLTAYRIGPAVTDTRTGEVIDNLEEPVGDVEIVRVTDKLSFARILGGDATRMTRGTRLRRPPVAPACQQAAPSASSVPSTPTTVRGASNGGVVTPF